MYPDRVTTAGVPFQVTMLDFSIATIEFASGAAARLTANFYYGFQSKQSRKALSSTETKAPSI
jgi:hypothetical protein